MAGPTGLASSGQEEPAGSARTQGSPAHTPASRPSQAERPSEGGSGVFFGTQGTNGSLSLFFGAL